MEKGIVATNVCVSMKKVFISSTFKDLKPHRNQILKTLEEFNVELVGMENFGARESKPLATCIAEIERSDIYIGIIAMSYGSIDENTQKSFTQLEYEKARELGLDLLIYLLDDYDGELLAGNIDFGEKYLALANFKKVLRHNHTVVHFKNETDLAAKIYRDLANVLIKYESERLRPIEIPSSVFRIEFDDVVWKAFLGFLNGKPYELLCCPADDVDGILVPNSANKGKNIIDFEENGKVRYDFQFLNLRGYKTTVQGINSFADYQISRYSAIITKLFQSQLNTVEIIEIIMLMNFDDEKYNEWKNEIIKILKDTI